MRRVWLAAFMLGGCAASTPQFDAHFGQSTRGAMLAQQRDAGASERNRGRNPDGLEARAAREAIERYYKSFGSPPPAGNVFNIGVGEGGAQK
jgi:hypothetical protein